MERNNAEMNTHGKNKIQAGPLKYGRFFALGLIFAIHACGPTQDVGNLKHELDKPLPNRGAESWQWESVTDAEYDSAIMPLVGMSGANFVDQEHVLTRRMQFWLDTLDGQLRRDFPQQMRTVPRPKARVMIEPRLNAFVAPVATCYDIKVKTTTGSVSRSETYQDGFLLDVGTGQVQLWPGSQYECVSADSESAVHALVADLGERLNGCRIRVTNRGRSSEALEITGDCDLSVGNYKMGSRLVVISTAAYVTAYSGIIAGMEENEFIAVMAHELGHYYKSHSTKIPEEYDFFYRIGQRNLAIRPQPDQDLRSMGEKAVAASRVLTNADLLETTEGAHYRADMYFTVGSIIKVKGRNVEACAEARELIASEAFNSAVGYYPIRALDEAGNAAYENFEAKAQPCLAALRYSNQNVSWTYIKEVTRGPVFPAWLENLSPQGQRYMARVFGNIADRLVIAPRASYVSDAIDRISHTLGEQERLAVGDLKRAYVSRVGQYTAEQEADELSAEWVSDIGIDPKEAVDVQATLGSGTDNGLRGYLFGSETCEELYQRGWLDTDGSAMFVPIGNYDEVHHSSCFRMFNLDREIDTHGLTAQGSRPTPPGDTWRTLQEIARNLGSEVNGDGQGGHEMHAHPIIRPYLQSDCIYGPRFY